VTEEELNLFEFAASVMAEAGASAPKIMGRQMVDANSLGISFNRVPDYVGCHSSILPSPIFETRLNTLPSVTCELRSQASTRPLDQAGTGTVRSRPPFPIKSTMTQGFSLNCS
jgi:hypothetical protein